MQKIHKRKDYKIKNEIEQQTHAIFLLIDLCDIVYFRGEEIRIVKDRNRKKAQSFVRPVYK